MVYLCLKVSSTYALPRRGQYPSIDKGKLGIFGFENMGELMGVNIVAMETFLGV